MLDSWAEHLYLDALSKADRAMAMLAYVKRKWRFLLIITVLLILNSWVWYHALTVDDEQEIKPVEMPIIVAAPQGWTRS